MPASKLFSSQGRNLPFALFSAFSRAAAAFLLCVAFLGMEFTTFAQTNITEFPIARQTPLEPTGITYGPDGNYWFTEFAFLNGVVATIASGSNVITEFGLTNNPDAGAFGIAAGPDGHLWFTEYAVNYIGRMETNGHYVEYPLTNVDASPAVITAGPDGKMWFVEYKLSKIATFDPNNPTNGLGQVVYKDFGPFETNTQFGLPGTNAELYGLTSGPDGNLWFTQSTYGEIGRLTPTGTATLFHLVSSNCQPLSIVAGPDGAMWFTEFNTNKIGRITLDGLNVREFTIPQYPGVVLPEPYGIISAADGNLWFTEHNSSAIGRITPNGIVTVFLTPTDPGLPYYLASGPAGGDTNIYFTEFSSQGSTTIDDAVGRLLVSQSLNLSAGNLVAAGTNFTGLVGAFQNSTAINTVTVYWGDGTTSTLAFNNTNVNASATVTNVVVKNSITNFNTLTVTNVTPIATNGNNGMFQILANHTYVSNAMYSIGINVTDARDDMAVATNLVMATGGMMAFHPAGTNIVVTWPGANFILQSAPSSAGVWTNVPGATSPYTNSDSGAPKYFRLKAF